MELIPAVEIGWRNGWIPLIVLVLVEGVLLKVFPREVVARLFDRSTWNRRQVVFTAIGKLFSFACLALLVLTPLKIGSGVFIVGVVLYVLGLVGLVAALFDYRATPVGQPVTRGSYRVSRHPQIVMLFVAFLGMCLTIGSWLALLTLLISRLLQHFGILAEEEACLAQYGDPYRVYLRQVPRYFLFF